MWWDIIKNQFATTADAQFELDFSNPMVEEEEKKCKEKVIQLFRELDNLEFPFVYDDEFTDHQYYGVSTGGKPIENITEEFACFFLENVKKYIQGEDVEIGWDEVRPKFEFYTQHEEEDFFDIDSNGQEDRVLYDGVNAYEGTTPDFKMLSISIDTVSVDEKIHESTLKIHRDTVAKVKDVIRRYV